MIEETHADIILHLLYIKNQWSENPSRRIIFQEYQLFSEIMNNIIVRVQRVHTFM